MPKSSLLAPDPFSFSPFLSVLPEMGDVSKLKAAVSSLYARFQRMHELSRELEARMNPEIHKKVLAETQMLQQILNYLEVDTEVK